MKAVFLFSVILLSLSCYSQRTFCKVESVICRLHPLGYIELEAFSANLESNTSAVFASYIVYNPPSNDLLFTIGLPDSNDYLLKVDEFIAEANGKNEDGINWIAKDYKCSQRIFDVTKSDPESIDVRVKYIRFETGKLRFVFRYPSYTLIYDGIEDPNDGKK